jgi:hypothetical protein
VGRVKRECTSEICVEELVAVQDGIGDFVLSTPSDCQADDMLHFTASFEERNALEVTVTSGGRESVDSEQIRANFKLWQVACEWLDGKAVEKGEIFSREVVSA